MQWAIASQLLAMNAHQSKSVIEVHWTHPAHPSHNRAEQFSDPCG